MELFRSVIASPWAAGLLVSLGAGWIATSLFLHFLRRIYGVTKDSSEKTVPGWITGFIERLFFTIVVAVNLPGTAVAMVGWITAKMATNWNRPDNKSEDGQFLRFSALLSGLVSMGFATAGGLLVRYGLTITPI